MNFVLMYKDATNSLEEGHHGHHRFNLQHLRDSAFTLLHGQVGFTRVASRLIVNRFLLQGMDVDLQPGDDSSTSNVRDCDASVDRSHIAADRVFSDVSMI